MKSGAFQLAKNYTFCRLYILCPLNPCECIKNQKITHTRVIFKNQLIGKQLTNLNPH